MNQRCQNVNQGLFFQTKYVTVNKRFGGKDNPREKKV